MSKIVYLSGRLAILGYNEFEINEIIGSVIGNKNINTINKKQEKEVVYSLRKYLKLGKEFIAKYSK